MKWDETGDDMHLVERDPVRGADGTRTEASRVARAAGLAPSPVVLKAALRNVAPLLSRSNATLHFSVDGARAAEPMPETAIRTP
jgi:hypothetical protein